MDDAAARFPFLKVSLRYYSLYSLNHNFQSLQTALPCARTKILTDRVGGVFIPVFLTHLKWPHGVFEVRDLSLAQKLQIGVGLSSCVPKC